MDATNQRGVVLIVAFFIMTIMIAIVLNVGAILFGQIKTARIVTDSLQAFYVADSSIEKTLYFDRRQIPLGANRGACNICNVCKNTGLSCNHCTALPLATDGCSILHCNNCQISFDGILGNNPYTVTATVSPDGLFMVEAQGASGDVTRKVVGY